MAAQLAGNPDFNTEELEALLHDLPTPDDANQAAVMTHDNGGGSGGELHVIVCADTYISPAI